MRNNIYIGLGILLLYGCGTKEPFYNEVSFECFRDTVEIYIPIKHIPLELEKKIDTLKKENHLLRVEIDHLKAEAINFEKKLEISRKVAEVKKNLNKLKKELCD